MRKGLMILVIVVVTGASGCSAQKGVDRVKRMNQLKEIGLSYHKFCTDNPGKAPQKAEDLITKDVEADTAAALKSGDIVFIYGVSVSDIVKTGKTAETIVAYGKEVPEKGGPVLRGNAEVESITADEFKSATLAKKPEKQ